MLEGAVEKRIQTSFFCLCVCQMSGNICERGLGLVALLSGAGNAELGDKSYYISFLQRLLGLVSVRGGSGHEKLLA